MKVSIVTPSYNQAQFIERTIQSVLSQDVPSLEYVVFDGGSTDGTCDVLKRYEDRLKWVSQSDKGQADAVNQGIAATDGEIIGWLNSDDIYYSGTLQRVVTFFSEHPNVDVVYGMADYVDVDDRAFDAYPTESWDFEWLKRTCFICQPALFFRRSVVDRFGLLDPTLMYCMDYEYWLRIAAGGAKFAYVRQKLAGSRMYPQNKTLRAQLEVRREINDMLGRRLGSVPDRWLYIYAHHVAELRVNQNAQSRMFGPHLAVQMMLAALRWNRGISAEMKDGLLGLVTGRRPLNSLFTIGLGRLPLPALSSITLDWGHIRGIYSDGWAGPSVVVQYGPGRPDRFVSLELAVPGWLPAQSFDLLIKDSEGQTIAHHRLARGEFPKIHVPLGGSAGGLEITIEPAFRPIELRELLGTTDARELTIMVRKIEAGEVSKLATVFPAPRL
jgi:hypothetical protein